MKLERAVIEINGGCNYSCAMCPQTNPGRGKNWLRKMPLVDFEDAVAQCTSAGATIINLEGSGEATLNPNLPEYISIVKKYGAKSYIFSNGRNMSGRFMKECVDAGLDFFRFSIIGYDAETYYKWMNSLAFNQVLNNLKLMTEYVEKSKSRCTVATYHLITDNDNIEEEKSKYLSLTVGLSVKTEIWKMHNWSGVYVPEYQRAGNTKTCGRPFSPDIVIRAGGLDGKTRAVHPCCQVLGRDDEAVLGHLSDNTVSEIWYGDAYEALRRQHASGDYPSYCRDCDFLIDDSEVLVYTNHLHGANHMHGTTFDLNDYRK